MNEIETKNIVEVLGFEIKSEDMKDKLIQNPDLKKKVEKWLDKHIGKGHMSSIKSCKVEYIDYDEINYDDLDEFELKELNKRIKNNIGHCPNHRTCPLFISDSLIENDNCILELLDTQYLSKGLVEELDIEKDDFNDQIIVGQLISLNILYNRAMRGLSSAPLIEEIKTFTKGGVNIDTKVNSNFEVIDRTLMLIEKLRKSLILNRDDKIKVKQIKKANEEVVAKKRVAERIRDIEEAQIMNSDIANEILNNNDNVEIDLDIDDI